MPPTFKRPCSGCGNPTMTISGVCHRCSRAQKDAAIGDRYCALCTAVIATDRRASSYCSWACVMQATSIASKASTVLRNAINKGKAPAMAPETLCVDCGAKATDFDHRDYTKPLDVEPVCRACNIRRGPALKFFATQQSEAA